MENIAGAMVTEKVVERGESFREVMIALAIHNVQVFVRVGMEEMQTALQDGRGGACLRRQSSHKSQKQLYTVFRSWRRGAQVTNHSRSLSSIIAAQRCSFGLRIGRWMRAYCTAVYSVCVPSVPAKVNVNSTRSLLGTLGTTTLN